MNGVVTLSAGQIISQVEQPDGSVDIVATMPCNTAIVLGATPNSGFLLDFIKKNGVSVPVNQEGDAISFNSDEEPLVSIRFKQAPPPPIGYNITLTRTAGSGTISPAEGTYTAIAGSSFTANINAAANWTITSIKINGANVALPAGTVSYTVQLTNIQMNYDVVVTFGQTLWQFVAYVVGGSGSVSPSTSTYVAPNTNIPVTITPSPGWEIASANIDGVSYPLSSRTAQTIYIRLERQLMQFYVTFRQIVNTGGPIEFYIASRLTGDNFQATAWQDIQLGSVSVASRSASDQGFVISPVVFPYPYGGTNLSTSTVWNTPSGALGVSDTYFDNRHPQYLRLALNALSKSGSTLTLQTRLNNTLANGGAGFTAGQVSVCQLIVTNSATGVSQTFTHPVQPGITDVSHNYTIPSPGLYTIETRTIIVDRYQQTSYSKSYVKV
jgi:hypothetical protein